MDDSDDIPPLEATTDPEMRQLLGLFDAPAFSRRGLELEYALERLDERCRRERDGMLDMVRLRLRQWAAAVPGPDAWASSFAEPIESLWPLSGAEPSSWGRSPASSRRLRSAAHDLTASVGRFNQRWERFLERLDLAAMNALIENYNRYYLLEKECVLGSRLAARHFTPRPKLTLDDLRRRFPPLPVPEPIE